MWRRSLVFGQDRACWLLCRLASDLHLHLTMRNLVLILMLFAPSLVFARSNRVAQVPHGSNFGCDICHTAAGGLTNFGFDSFTYTENGNVVWANLANKDSDGDGYTNGVELGDPNGVWRTGQAAPGGAFTDPNDADDNFCGDGTLQANEDCEGTDLQGATCQSLELGDGTLRCTDRCVYDVEVCGGCGNDVKQNDEECDGRDLAGATCQVLGFESGSVSCGTDCRLITSACTGDGHGSVSALCGNGTRDVGENCDGSDLGAATCQTLGYSGGFLGCGDRCTFDVASCTTLGANPDLTPEAGSSDQTPDARLDEHAINFEGRACSSVGGETWWLVFLAAFGFRRRR